MSSSWWQSPYPGGPMVPVDGFPRALAVPGPGVPNSSAPAGPDVEAYKRTVSRAGRWPWGTFNQVFTREFAVGRAGGQVADSGVAGVQRQNNMANATGSVDQATFNLLRSIRVPAGLPNAGQAAMDATAVNLINQAFALYRSPPPSVGPLLRKWIASPNYSSRGGASVRLIVLHTAEGALTYQSLGSFFSNPSSQVSSHVGIDDTKGVVGEYVTRGNKAWTAANANPVAVQAELCAFAAWTTAEWQKHAVMLDNCARWLAEEAKVFGVPLTRLSPAAAQGSGRGVCEHVDLGAWGGSHYDCGSAFPIDSVIVAARGYMGGS